MTDERGLSIIEVLVAISLFFAMAIGIYQVMFSSIGASDTTRAVASIAEEARLGFNRIVRDTREAAGLACAPTCPTETSYTINLDFDEDGAYESPNEAGQHEVFTYSFDAARNAITVRAAATEADLIRGVVPIAGTPIFSYQSNRLDYDGLTGTPDGTVTWQEVDAAPRVGNANGVLDSPEIPYISNVTISFAVESGRRSTQFFSEAQLRNRR